MTSTSVFFLLAYQVVLVCLAADTAVKPKPCTQDYLDTTFVTKCGPETCEQLLEGSNNIPSEWPNSKEEVKHVISSRDGDRLKVSSYPGLDTTRHFYEEVHTNVTIFVDPGIEYQRIVGFGTTLTDIACKNVDGLPEDVRSILVNDYFSPDQGIGLNLLKVPIGSTAYSFSNYALDQPDGVQVELSAYDIDHRIPLINDALIAAGRLKNRIKIIASCSSAPPSYKFNNRIDQGGRIRQDKMFEYATYLNSFITAFKNRNINIWALILSENPVKVDNDKNVTGINHASMIMKPSDTVRLIQELNRIRSRQSDQYRLLLLGDNKSHMPVWTDAVLKSSDLIAKSVAGVAYSCSNRDYAPYDNLVYVTRRYPSKYLLATQGSANSPIKLGNWQYAENYASEIVKNLEYGSIGWIDFNLALDLSGGHALATETKSDAAVMIDPRTNRFYRNPMFYAIGHISRYVKPGSVRVKSSLIFGAHMYANQHIAFKTPDNYLVAFVMNNNIGPMAVSIAINTKTRVTKLLKTKSFNTFIFRL